jgi:hypothetical protein
MSITTKYDTLIQTGATLRIVYRCNEGEVTERTVRVERVVTSTQHGIIFWAHCYRRDAIRMFYAARILFAMPDDSTQLVTFAADRPPGLPVPTTDLRMLLAATGMDAWHADRAMQTAATA